jgi:hypothetical protein
LKNNELSTVKVKTEPTAVDFRTIIKEARDDEIAEESEQNRRICNLILHGVQEESLPNNERAKKMDEAYVASFIEALKVPIVYKSFTRIGTDSNKTRPIKIVFKNEENKNTVMKSLINLKDEEKFCGLSVTEDYTQKQRQTIKEWINKAKQRNSEELPDSQYLWKARGTPKNGMFLKKLIKRKINATSGLAKSNTQSIQNTSN